MTLVTIGRASSAASTEFVSAWVDLPGGLYLHVDGNQKITRGNGTYAAPMPNALSLLAGNGDNGDEPGHEREHCPGSTPTCRSACYVGNLEKHAGSTYALYEHNSAIVRDVVASCDSLHREACAQVLGEWITCHAGGGFRWHVSGDVFSTAHARWIASACAYSPDVEHWIYTRSFAHVEPLTWVATFAGGNLALNLSCDANNYAAAREVRDRYAARSPDAWGPRLCYLTRDGVVPDDLTPDSVVFPDYALRGAKGGSPSDQRASSPWWQSLSGDVRRMVCPTDFYGKSDGARCGPCARCLT